MNKIGQVTLSHYNYGSALQTYATQQIVANMGYECVLLELACPSQWIHQIHYLFAIVKKFIRYPKFIHSFMQQLRSVRRSSLSYMTDSDIQNIERFLEQNVRKISLSMPELKQLANSDEFAVILTGSDQVWNGSWFLDDPMRFLHFVPPHKRVSWAASFGTDNVAPYNLARFKKDIATFMSLSVRETRGAEIVARLTGRSAEIIADPVLQLSPAWWREKVASQNWKPEHAPYLFVFFLNEPCCAAIKQIRKIAGKGMNVYAFANKHRELKKIDGIQFISGDPWDYLNAVMHCQYVISDSFHALAFACIFRKKMLIYRRQYTHNADQSGRIVSLLEKAGLSGRFLAEDQNVDIDAEIDFDRVDQFLREESEKGRRFLENAIRKSREASSS